MARETIKVPHNVMNEKTDEIVGRELHEITVRALTRDQNRKLVEKAKPSGKDELLLAEMGLLTGMTMQEETALAQVTEWKAKQVVEVAPDGAGTAVLQVQDDTVRTITPDGQRKLLGRYDYFLEAIAQAAERVKEANKKERERLLGNC